MYTIKEISPELVIDCTIEMPYIVVDSQGMDVTGEAMEKEEAQTIADDLNKVFPTEN